MLDDVGHFIITRLWQACVQELLILGHLALWREGGIYSSKEFG